MLEQVFEHNLLNDNSAIGDSIWLFGADRNSILGENTLVLRLSDLYCTDCTRFILLKLMRLSQNSDFRNHIVIFASYQNKRELSLMLEKMSIDFPVYFIGKLPLKVEELNYPYCFMLNKNGEVYHLFVPDRNQPDLANFYFETLKNRYYN